MEMVAFLSARLDEDEAAARAATPGPWEFEGDDPTDDELFTVHNGEHGDLVGEIVAFTRGRQVQNGEHMARHDPVRVLRGVAAGRARLALMIEATAEMDRLLADKSAALADQAMAIGRARAATAAVKQDAAVHNAHPDYMPEWKPPAPARA